MARSPRDIEQIYSTADVVAKLRRLADALEADKSFRIQIAGVRIRVPCGPSSPSSMSATTTRKRSSSSSSGQLTPMRRPNPSTLQTLLLSSRSASDAENPAARPDGPPSVVRPPRR